MDPNIIGLDTYGTAATYQGADGSQISWANQGDGIRVDGNARDVRISGNLDSVIPQNTISNNNGYGIRLADQASGILIGNAYLGLSSTGLATFGNQLGGLFAGAGVRGLQIGSEAASDLPNKIVGNGGNGISLLSPVGAKILNSKLLNNTGSGLSINGGNSNTVAGNQADSNGAYGFTITASTNS